MHQPGYLGAAKIPRVCRPNLPSTVPLYLQLQADPKGQGSAYHEPSITSTVLSPVPHAIPYITGPVAVSIFTSFRREHLLSSERLDVSEERVG